MSRSLLLVLAFAIPSVVHTDTLVGTASAQRRSSKKKKRVKRERGLAPKKDITFDSAVGKTKAIKRDEALSDGPSLSLKELERAEIDTLIDEKVDEEIKIAKQLLKVEEQCERAGPVRFRLADLYWEKSKRAFFRANDFETPEKDRKRYTALMKKLQLATVENYQRLVEDCPDSRDFAKTLYYLGKALVEMERHEEGSKHFRRIIKEYPDTEWVPNSWFMVGEYFFNQAADVAKALRAYTRASEYEDAPIYGYAIYKQGWCYVNTGDWDVALDRFRKVISIARAKRGALDKRGRISLKREGMKDYVRAYSHVGDVAKATSDFTKVAGKREVPKMLEQLGQWYEARDFHRNVIAVYRDLIKLLRRSSRIPVWQGRIVNAASKIDKKATIPQVKLLTKYFSDARRRVENAAGESDEKARKDLAEAEDIAENTLRRLALEYHKEAKKLRGRSQDAMYRYAHDLYKHYLKVFPEPDPDKDVNYVFFMRFYYADVLYRLEDFLAAAENYETVVAMNPNPKTKRDKEILLTAAEEAVRSYDELVEDMDRKNPPVIGGTEPKPIPEIKQRLVTACERYIGVVGTDGPKIVEIRYKMARTWYTYNYFDKAAPAFNAIVENHPKNETACYAANLALDIYGGQKDYEKLRETARAYRENSELACNTADRARFASIEEKASFLLIKSKFEERKKHISAGKAYMSFYKAFPKSAFADDALNNAAYNFDLGGRLEEANKTRLLLVDRFPDSDLVPDTLHNIAQSYERIVDFESAARYLNRFVSRYPNDPKSKDALFNVGTYLTTLGDYAGAREARQTYLGRYPKDSDLHRVALAMCEAAEKEATKNKRKWPAAYDCYDGYARNSRYEKKDPDFHCYAAYRATEISRIRLRDKRKTQRYGNYIRGNWKKWKRRYGAKKLPKCATGVAELEFRELEESFGAYTSQKVAQFGFTDKGKAKFQKSVRQKVAARDQLIARYKAVVEIGVAEWALASLFKIGEAWKNSVDSVMNAPVPTRIFGQTLNAEQKEQVRGKLAELASSSVASAVEAYELCVQKANELGVYNKWSVRALTRLQKLRPEQYQPANERAPSLKFPDPLKVAKNGVVVRDGEELVALRPKSKGKPDKVKKKSKKKKGGDS